MQLKLLAAFSASFLVSKSAGVFVSSTFEVQPRLNRKVIKKNGVRINVCFKGIVRIYTNLNMEGCPVKDIHTPKENTRKFQLLFHQLEYFGLCQNCYQAQN